MLNNKLVVLRLGSWRRYRHRRFVTKETIQD